MTTIENYFKNNIKIPFCAPLAMQSATLTAHLTQVYATAVEAFRPAISAVAMYQQPYMSIAEAFYASRYNTSSSIKYVNDTPRFGISSH